MASRKRSTAATGAAAPSRAHDNPPNAIMLAPTAALAKVTTCPNASRPAAASPAIAQNTRMFAASTSSKLHKTGRSRKRVACHCKSSSRRRRDVKRSTVHVGEPEQAQLLGGGRIDRQTIRVVRVALRLANFGGVAVAPDGAFAEEPMRGEPGSDQQQRRPPGEGCQHQRRGQSAGHLHHPGRDEIHRDRKRRAGDAEVEVARHGEIGGEARVFEVPHARRAGAGGGQLIVEPGGRAASEVRADCVMEGRQHLQQHEHHAGHAQRLRQRIAALHRADQNAHGDGEYSREQPPQHQRGPPGERERAVCLRENAEKCPFFRRFETAKTHFP